MVEGIFSFLTGIGLLLFGVQFMGQSVEKILGANFRKKLNKFASNRFSSFGLGTILTFALQSSTASTAMFVSFAGAGIVTLFQGINLIIGANVGTALSSCLLAFKSINIVEIIASFVLIGFLINILAKKNVKLTNIGNTLIGFGILFGGLVLIGYGTDVFKGISGFETFITKFTNPFLLIVIGMIITIVLQSSFGTFAIVISLMATGTSAGFSLISACYLIYGINIGTCLTTIITGLSTNTDGKRVAWFHLLFNLLGTLIFTLFTLFTPWVNWFETVVTNQTLQVLIVNLAVNVITAIITLPLANPLAKLMKVVVKRSKKETENPYIIRTSELETPTIAIKKLNYQALSLINDYKNCFNKVENFILSSETDSIKELKQNLLELENHTNNVYSNSIRISGFIEQQDQKIIHFVQQSCNNLSKVLNNYKFILDQMTIENNKLVFSEKRQNIFKTALKKIDSIFDLETEIYESLYNENIDYKCYETVKTIIDISDELSLLKTNDKKQIVDSLSQKKDDDRITQTMNIINELSDMKNSLVDMSAGSLEFFKNNSNEVV